MHHRYVIGEFCAGMPDSAPVGGGEGGDECDVGLAGPVRGEGRGRRLR